MLSTVNHVFSQMLTKVCDVSGEGGGGARGTSLLKAMWHSNLGVIIVNVGVDAFESSPSKMSMSGRTRLTTPDVERRLHALTLRQGDSHVPALARVVGLEAWILMPSIVALHRTSGHR